MPRQKHNVIFGKGELTRSILDELRSATGSMGSREIAQANVALDGKDARDRKLITDLTRRASKALRILKGSGDVRSSVDTKGNLMWTLRALHR